MRGCMTQRSFLPLLKRHAGLVLCLLLAAPPGHAAAEEFDAIVSEPPKPDQPFFGDAPDVKGERPEPDQPFFGEQVMVEEEKPVPRQAEARPRRQSDRLEIPAEARRRGDLSFLKGCWYMEKRVSRHDKPGTPYARTIQESICLDGHGGGTFRVHAFDNGWTVSARARARFDGSTLVFEHGDMRFPDGMRFYGSSFQCRGAGIGTSCAKYCPSCRYIPKHRTLRITRTP